jgi:hypothetical protein
MELWVVFWDFVQRALVRTDVPENISPQFSGFHRVTGFHSCVTVDYCPVGGFWTFSTALYSVSFENNFSEIGLCLEKLFLKKIRTLDCIQKLES